MRFSEHSIRRLAGLLAFVALCLGASVDGGDLSYQGSSVWHGVNDIVLDGKWGYCAAPYGLMILDISDTPGVASELYQQGRGLDLVKIGNLVYLVDDYGGLKIIDVSYVYGPAVIGEYQSDRPIQRVAVEDTIAYLAAPPGKLDIVNIADPTHPVLIHRYDFADPWADVTSMQVSNHRLFLVDRYMEVTAFDVTDPQAPVEKGTLRISNQPAETAIDGQYMYLATLAEVEGFKGAIWSVDISDLTSMVLLDSIALAGSGNDIVVTDTVAVAATTQGVMYINCADPHNLIKLATVPTTGWPVNVSVSGTNTLVNASQSWQSQLVRVNHTDVTVPYVELTLPIPSMPVGLGVAGHYAYVATIDEGLLVLDIADPAHPVMVRTMALTGQLAPITIAGQYAYVPARNIGLHILDIADSANPVLLTTYKTPGSAQTVAVRDTLVFIADWSLLHIINVANPASPLPVGSWSQPGQGWVYSRVEVKDSIAYIGYGGLYMVNCANPASPVYIGQVTGGGGSVAVNGNLLATIGSLGVLRIYDITNPAVPVQVGNYSAVGNTALSFAGNRVYVVSDEDGPYGYYYRPTALQVIDVTSPSAPVLVARYRISGSNMWQIAAIGDRVLAAESDGLLDLQFECCVGMQGNIDNDPYNGVDISDLSVLIDHLYISMPPLSCVLEADLDRSGNIDISDLSLLIDYLYISLAPLLNCP